MRIKLITSLIALSLKLITGTAYAEAAEPTPRPRIITLAPHLTEMLFEQGLEKQLVGTDDHSNYPPAVITLPKVGSGFSPNYERLLHLQPDIILQFTPNSQLEQRYPDKSVRFINSHPESVAALFADWERILDVTQASNEERQQADRTLAQASSDWQKLQEQYQSFKPKRVFFLISTRPIYSVSDKTFLSDAIATCNTVNIVGDRAQTSFIVNPEALLVNPPEVVIHGYNAQDSSAKDEARANVLQLFERLGIALTEQQIISVDADILHRPTLRLMRALPSVCEAVHGG